MLEKTEARMPRSSGVYEIKMPEGVYIGSSGNLFFRQYGHDWDLKSGRHSCKALQDSYDRGGRPTYTVLELCGPDTLTDREAYWGNRASGKLLNTAPPGSFIYPRTPDSRAKTRASALKQWATPERLRRKYAMLECIALGMHFTEARKKFGFHHHTARKWVDAKT